MGSKAAFAIAILLIATAIPPSATTRHVPLSATSTNPKVAVLSDMNDGSPAPIPKEMAGDAASMGKAKRKNVKEEKVIIIPPNVLFLPPRLPPN